MAKLILAASFAAVRGLRMPEPSTIKHANQFITHFVLQSRQHEPMQLAVLQCGAVLVQTVIECCGLHTPRTHTELYADVFLALSKTYPEQFVVWMKLLETPDYPSNLITPSEKNVFMKAIVK